MTHAPLVFDLETAAPLTDPPPAPEDWLVSGIRDNFKPDTIDRYRADNAAQWPAEWRKRAGLDWRLGRIVAGGIGDGAEVYTLYARGEREEKGLLTFLWEHLARARPCIGFNIRSFDLPWLAGRSLILGVPVSRILHNVPKWKTEQVVDLMDTLSGTASWAGWTLGAYGTLLGVPSATIGSGADVAGWVEHEDASAVLAHLQADLWVTWHLYERCRPVYGL